MNNLTCITAATAQPISLAQAKQHLRIWHDDDDAYLTALVAAAVATIEGPTGIGLALMDSTWLQTMDSTVTSTVMIDLTPVKSVEKVETQDSLGAWTVVDPSRYRVNTDQRPALLSPVTSWPVHSAMRITFKAGYSDVPADLIAALLLIAGYLYENRAEDAPTPRAIDAILARYR